MDPKTKILVATLLVEESYVCNAERINKKSGQRYSRTEDVRREVPLRRIKNSVRLVGLRRGFKVDFFRDTKEDWVNEYFEELEENNPCPLGLWFRADKEIIDILRKDWGGVYE